MELPFNQPTTTDKQQPVTVLGRTFANDEERRTYFREELRKQLPELKKIEGFPIGVDEDILNLSDPPYYTACPNPWINDFIAQWEAEKTELELEGKRTSVFNVDEPYASDVSEGKTNQLYAAHSYHTKVPHPAIMRYILHYTQPGDIVFDGFAGTGMTAVAAISCENPDIETKQKIEFEWKSLFGSIPLWGARKAMVGDLAPIASFIAYNYTNPIDIEDYETELKRILSDFDQNLGWMYETNHSNGKIGKINYVVWSEIFGCPNCNHEFIFTEQFYDPESKSVKDEVNCPSCSKLLTKNSCNLIFETVFDKGINQAIKRPKRVPYSINYNYSNTNYSKKPDDSDISLINRISELPFPEVAPNFKLPDIQMIKVGRVRTTNIEYIHDFYLYRAIQTLAFFWKKAQDVKNERIKSFLLFTFEQLVWGISLLSRYVPTHFSQVNQYLSGVFYIASHIAEISPNYLLVGKIKRLTKAFNSYSPQKGIVINYCGDCISLNMRPNSVDYIFTDPPFGENIYYSDLNMLIEAWHRVLTNAKNEAIIDKVKIKTILDYQYLMELCFKKYYEILKPGKWMTVEFSNTSAAVWNGIQKALQKAGFSVANVSALDKKQGTFQAIISTTAVKQDLVISCYKPSLEFENKFKSINSDIAIWDFVSEHLQHLPVYMKKDNMTTAIVERTDRILFDRLISFYLMRGLPIPIDAGLFQKGLKERFIERDGMYFTAEQVHEYDSKKAELPNFVQLSLLVASEQDGVMWLRRELEFTPQTYQELQPKWMQALAGVRKGDILPELRDILEENFLQNEAGAWYLPDLENEIDLERVRTRRLLKQFDSYKEQAAKPKGKIKEARVEALRVGFKQCYKDKDFKTIVTVGDSIPNNLLMEDEVLLQYYDIAISRV